MAFQHSVGVRYRDKAEIVNMHFFFFAKPHPWITKFILLQSILLGLRQKVQNSDLQLHAYRLRGAINGLTVQTFQCDCV